MVNIYNKWSFWHLKDKLKQIKIFISDVDGVLTDGKIWWQGEEVGFNRSFHAHDGHGMKVLQKSGLKVGVISGGYSVGLVKRIEYLKLDFSYLGNEDKMDAWEDVKKKYCCQDQQILYIGDELFDIPLLKLAGFSAAPPDSPREILQEVDYITQKNGGNGCVREVIDMLRMAQR